VASPGVKVIGRPSTTVSVDSMAASASGIGPLVRIGGTIRIAATRIAATTPSTIPVILVARRMLLTSVCAIRRVRPLSRDV